MQEELLKRIENDTVTRSDAAKEAGVSVRTINRWMRKAGIKRPKRQNRKANDNKTARRSAALLVFKRQVSPEQAARLANCSTRTIYRYLKRLKAMLGEPDVQ